MPLDKATMKLYLVMALGQSVTSTYSGDCRSKANASIQAKQLIILGVDLFQVSSLSLLTVSPSAQIHVAISAFGP